ncbi:MAG: hypothetical protein J6C39_00250 [Clostridia bacterium]|nr:hypothetical protein [Clostridia bacterium]MBO5316204.1 hypothetical protein [Clostridia bacterium]
MKKRIIAIITAALLLTLFAFSASAAGSTATTETKSCAKGDTVTLNVSVSSTEGVNSGAVEVIFDSTRLELIDGSFNVQGALLSNFDKATSKGAFAFNGEGSVSGNIFSVRFKVLTDAPLGDTAVQCKIQLKAGNADLPVTNTEGKITVTCNHSFTKQDTTYQASPASCTSSAKYYYSCSICGEKGTSTFNVGEPTPHTYDKKVNTAGYLVSPVTCADTAEFYFSCACGAKGSEKFTGDAAFSHSYTESWLVGKDGHWHGCSACGKKKDYSVHIGEMCSVCSFVTEGDHFHSFGAEYKSSDAAHWQECSCGEKQNIELHTAGSDNKCSICRRQLPVISLPIGPGGDADDGEGVTIDFDKIRTENDLTVALITSVIVICAVGVIETVVFVTLRAVKKKKSSLDSEPAEENKGE